MCDYLYFIVFANTFSTKCEFIIDISILAAGQNWAFCDFWWKSIIFRILVKVIFLLAYILWCELYCIGGYFRTTKLQHQRTSYEISQFLSYIFGWKYTFFKIVYTELFKTCKIKSKRVSRVRIPGFLLLVLFSWFTTLKRETKS